MKTDSVNFDRVQLLGVWIRHVLRYFPSSSFPTVENVNIQSKIKYNEDKQTPSNKHAQAIPLLIACLKKEQEQLETKRLFSRDTLSS